MNYINDVDLEQEQDQDQEQWETNGGASPSTELPWWVLYQ